MFEFGVTITPGEVRIRGDLDLVVAERFREAVTSMGARNGHILVVDMTDLTYIDSSGLTALVQARRELQRDGVSLRVTNPNPHVLRVLQVTGLDQTLL